MADCVNQDGCRIPPQTREERLAALEKGHRLLHERKVLLEAVKAGRVAPEAVMMRRDEAARGIRVERWIRMWPGYGEAKARRVMRECRIASNRKVGALGTHQRERLAAWLAENPPKPQRRTGRA